MRDTILSKPYCVYSVLNLIYERDNFCGKVKLIVKIKIEVNGVENN